jgi:phosphate transport system substrate-binding protein
MSSPRIPPSPKPGPGTKSRFHETRAYRKVLLFGLVLLIASILLFWFYTTERSAESAPVVLLNPAPQEIVALGSPAAADVLNMNIAPAVRNGGGLVKVSEVDNQNGNSTQQSLSDDVPRDELPFPRIELETLDIRPEPADAYVRISGAFNVAPITSAVATEFHTQMNGKARVVMSSSGTPGGFQKFCRGQIDVVQVVRPILKNEMQACAAAGIGYFETPVAYEAVAVVVDPSTTWLDGMTVNELKGMWRPASRGLNNWNAISARWPNQNLILLGAKLESPAYEFFTYAVVGVSWASRRDFIFNSDGSMFALWLNQYPGALGFLQYSSYASRTDKMKALKIVNSHGHAVAPTETTVLDGSYHPLSRALFIYVNDRSAGRPEVREFVTLYLSKGAQFVRQVGYVSLSDPTYDNTLTYFRQNKLGTVFGGLPVVTTNMEEAIHRERRL